MQDLKAVFEAYGVDYQTTMNRFMGNNALYLKLLDLLFQDTNLRQLGEALDMNDLSGAFVAAHTLKGVVGNMGLSLLYDAVSAIVVPLRIGEPRDDYQAMFAAIQAEFQKADRFRASLKEGGQIG